MDLPSKKRRLISFLGLSPIPAMLKPPCLVLSFETLLQACGELMLGAYRVNGSGRCSRCGLLTVYGLVRSLLICTRGPICARGVPNKAEQALT